MYFPVLHGAQNEMLALEEVALEIRTSGAIIPVIIPLGSDSDTKRLQRVLRRYNRSAQPFCLVVNPRCCAGVASVEKIDEHLIHGILADNQAFFPMFVVDRSTTAPQIRAFQDRFTRNDIGFFHQDEADESSEAFQELVGSRARYHLFAQPGTGRGYETSFPARTRVRITDPFTKRKNADYPPDEAFSDAHLTFRDEGLAGFGDYMTIGKDLTKGFAPYAVALHMTYITPTGRLRLRHFVSDRTETIEDTAGKYQEAVRKLVDWADANPSLVTVSESVEEFRASAVAGTYPGLGIPKRLSMRRHLQLMGMLLPPAS